MDQRLVHYSKTTLTSVRSACQEVGPTTYLAKPNGLWVSVEGNGDGWRDWCEEEDFALDSFEYAHEIRLSDRAKILHLENAVGLDLFHSNYRFEGGRSFSLNWGLVAQTYDGIIIAPYIRSRRLSGDAAWYYGWDCASGCIWNAKAIAQVSFVP